jgi:Protein of unknown function (DUF4031)
VILVDPPRWPAQGRLWSHLASDVALVELHVFAELLGVPAKAFDRDHYDLPADGLPHAVWLGARLVPTREIAARLSAAGLRRPKRAAGLRRPKSPVGSPRLTEDHDGWG